MTNNEIQSVEQVATQITKMSEAIATYGAGVVAIAIIFVILLIFMVFFLVFFKNISSENTRRTDKIIEWFEGEMSRRASTDVVKSSITSTNIIVDHLKYACSETKCDRAAIYVFHNGQFLLNGCHIMKFSCLVEFSLLSKYNYISEQKDIPISQIQNLCNRMLNHENLVFETLSDSPNSPLEEWCLKLGMKSLVARPVYNKEGYIIGFATAEYYNDKLELEDAKDAASAVRSLADKVSITMDLGVTPQ